MIHRLLLALLFFLFVFPGLSRVHAATIAISYFDNTSGDLQYNPLSKGIADMLITDLSKIPGLSIVEREDLEKLIKEIELGRSRYFDNATAQKLGKGLGAQSILTGAFLVLDEQMRIDARLIDVASGKILAAEAVNGSRNDFFSLHKQLVALLTKTLKVKDAQVSQSSGKVDLAAVLKYSEALEQFDRGLTVNAGDLLASTIKAYPQFTFAKDRLEKLKAWLAKAEEERNRLIEQETRSLMSSISMEDPQAGQKINQVWTSLLTSYNYSAILSVNKKFREKGVKAEARMYGEASPITFGEMMLYYDALALYSLKRYSELLPVGQEFISRYPTSMYFSGIKMYMDESIKELETREKGRREAESSIRKVEFETYVDQLDRISNRWKLDNMSPEKYSQYRELFVRNVLKYGDEELKGYVKAKGEYADELFEFKESAAHFMDTVLLEKIAKKAIDIYSGTEMEESAYRLEDWVDREKKRMAKIREEVQDARKALASAKSEDIKELMREMRAIEESHDHELIEKICRAWLGKFKEPEHSRRQAWESLVLALGRQEKWEEAAKALTEYEADVDLSAKDASAHKQECRRLKTALNDVRKAREESDGLQMALYAARAELFNKLHQYGDEAVVRRQIIDKFELDETFGSMHLYLLMTAYTNLGYFDQAQQVAKELLKKFPNSSYTSSLDYLIKFMPK